MRPLRRSRRRVSTGPFRASLPAVPTRSRRGRFEVVGGAQAVHQRYHVDIGDALVGAQEDPSPAVTIRRPTERGGEIAAGELPAIDEKGAAQLRCLSGPPSCAGSGRQLSLLDQDVGRSISSPEEGFGSFLVGAAFLSAASGRITRPSTSYEENRQRTAAQTLVSSDAVEGQGRKNAMFLVAC